MTRAKGKAVQQYHVVTNSRKGDFQMDKASVKFLCEDIVSSTDGEGVEAQFSTVYEESDSTLPPDNADEAPRMQIRYGNGNIAAASLFQAGQEYQVDFSRVV